MQTISQEQKKHFDLLYSTEKFRPFFYFVNRNLAKFIYNDIETIFPNTKVRVLDIGCGIGIVDFYLLQRLKEFEEIIGIDISQEGIKKANSIISHPKVKFFVMDYTDIYKLGKFDVVIATEFIEHIVDVNTFLKNVYNVLNNKGIVIISTPNKLRLQNRILRMLNKPLVLCDTSHYKEYSFCELRNLFTTNKFTIQTYKAYGLWGGWIVYYLLWFLPNKLKEYIAYTPFFRGENGISYYLGSIIKDVANFIYIVAKKS